MKCAIVTGASSGIGLAICKTLLSLNYKVYGFGRNFASETMESNNFIKVILDLTKTQELENKIKEIRKNKEIYLLINSAGCGFFGLHENLNAKKIHEMCTLNLEVPMILSNLLMRDLKKNNGTIINISSVTAKMSSPHGCAYGATKSGLTHFSESLFDENRKYGLKVITIHPDLTKTNFYRNADFETGDDLDTYLTPEDVADVVQYALKASQSNMIIKDITLSPQKHAIKRKK